MAKLIGLCAHFTYWSVFGEFNPMPLDDYHMKQLFISILQAISAIESSFLKQQTQKIRNLKREDPDSLVIDNTRQLYTNFTMPLFILSIRVNIEMIFKKNYVKFFKKKKGEDADQENS